MMAACLDLSWRRGRSWVSKASAGGEKEEEDEHSKERQGRGGDEMRWEDGKDNDGLGCHQQQQHNGS